MSKHTPGPWFIQTEESSRDGKEYTWIQPESQHWGVCRLPINTKRAPEESQANARLIAAAPELLEAAKHALKCLDAANETLGGWAGEEYYKVARNDLKKAIAKVEGETK